MNQTWSNAWNDKPSIFYRARSKPCLLSSLLEMRLSVSKSFNSDSSSMPLKKQQLSCLYYDMHVKLTVQKQLIQWWTAKFDCASAKMIPFRLLTWRMRMKRTNLKCQRYSEKNDHLPIVSAPRKMSWWTLRLKHRCRMTMRGTII